MNMKFIDINIFICGIRYILERILNFRNLMRLEKFLIDKNNNDNGYMNRN